jgi:hypothetical protein
MTFAEIEANFITCPRCNGTREDPLGVDAECYADVGGCDGTGTVLKGEAK